MKTYQKIGLYGALIAALAGKMFGQEKDSAQVKQNAPTISLGYNSIEGALSSDGNGRIRTYEGAFADLGPLRLSVRGMNEVQAGINGKVIDANTYFGRNVGQIGTKNSKTDLSVVVKTTAEGIIDTKYGISTTEAVKSLGCYGWTDLNTNTTAANATAFIGKGLGRGYSLELFESAEFPFGKKPSLYTELQLNKSITDNISVFARDEISASATPTYLFGISVHN